MPQEEKEPERSMEEVILADGRYPLEAFAFLHEALTKAVEKVHGTSEPGEKQRHVTGQQLCLGVRDLALERWGRLARTVLARWNIRETIDFGRMVYLLIEHNFMKKTEADSIEDFRDVYDFDEAFQVEDEFELKE
jgi:uncharacterized repeat protein (TIGR04138 family)